MLLLAGRNFSIFLFSFLHLSAKIYNFPLEKALDRKGGCLWRKGCILCLLISVISLPLIAQNIIYSNLKELLTQHGDTTAVLRCRKTFQKSDCINRRGWLPDNGRWWRVMCRRLKKRCFAVRDEKGNLYLNCRKLRYKKLRFGAWYAPAVQLGKNIYFCAMPLGSVIGGNFVEEDDVKLGGKYRRCSCRFKSGYKTCLLWIEWWKREKSTFWGKIECCNYWRIIRNWNKHIWKMIVRRQSILLNICLEVAE